MKKAPRFFVAAVLAGFVAFLVLGWVKVDLQAGGMLREDVPLFSWLKLTRFGLLACGLVALVPLRIAREKLLRMPKFWRGFSSLAAMIGVFVGIALAGSAITCRVPTQLQLYQAVADGIGVWFLAGRERS